MSPYLIFHCWDKTLFCLYFPDPFFSKTITSEQFKQWKVNEYFIYIFFISDPRDPSPITVKKREIWVEIANVDGGGGFVGTEGGLGGVRRWHDEWGGSDGGEIASGSPAVQIEEIALCFLSKAAGHFQSVGVPALARRPDFGHVWRKVFTRTSSNCFVTQTPSTWKCTSGCVTHKQVPQHEQTHGLHCSICFPLFIPTPQLSSTVYNTLWRVRYSRHKVIH